MRAFASLTLGMLFSGAAFSQSTETRPAFEAADIHPSAAARFRFMRGPTAHAGHYELRQANMVDLVATAYGLNQDEVLDGPSWLEEDRFDIVAKLPPDSTRETQKAMLQALLAERFKLVVRVGKRPMPAIA